MNPHESPNQNTEQQIKNRFLDTMMSYGMFSGCDLDEYSLEISKFINQNDESLKIYQNLVSDMIDNPEKYTDYPLALAHILFCELEDINNEIYKDFKKAEGNTDVPDLLHKKEIALAREIIERFKKVLDEDTVQEIIRSFHRYYNDSENDFLTEL